MRTFPRKRNRDLLIAEPYRLDQETGRSSPPSSNLCSFVAAMLFRLPQFTTEQSTRVSFLSTDLSFRSSKMGSKPAPPPPPPKPSQPSHFREGAEAGSATKQTQWAATIAASRTEEIAARARSACSTVSPEDGRATTFHRVGSVGGSCPKRGVLEGKTMVPKAHWAFFCLKIQKEPSGLFTYQSVMQAIPAQKATGALFLAALIEHTPNSSVMASLRLTLAGSPSQDFPAKRLDFRESGLTNLHVPLPLNLSKPGVLTAEVFVSVGSTPLLSVSLTIVEAQPEYRKLN